MEKIEVSPGVYLVTIPKAGRSVLCGCPPDVTKHLMKRGLIHRKPWDGGLFESGPDAILLSDLPLQGGVFTNMAEFPILQMFYRQGMIIPGHPGNTGRKPLILGLSQQLRSLRDYLFRGTYGLGTLEEIQACGVDDQLARELLRIKLAFSFEKIRKYDELLEMVSLDGGQVELAPGVTAQRLGMNRFRFTEDDQELEVDLNLPAGQTYPAPVTLGFHRIQRHYFSVIHVGEGDGWDPHRPCMSSIVMFQGKIYLIDTGPNILDSLTALGISVNEIHGIFQTHAHDDHFAGLTSLVRTDHRIAYFATPMVRSTIMKKLAAIMGLPEKRFQRTFEFHDLKEGQWNNIDGLEVKPILSIHPVETTVLKFRSMWEGGYKTYAHLADIASWDVMKRMLLDHPKADEFSRQLYERIAGQLLKPADIKKIDIGGGLIHGDARDFSGDRSKKIILAHMDRDLTTQEKEIGANVSFGQEDVLIPAHSDYVRVQAGAYLRSYFPQAARYDLHMLLNCPLVSFNSGVLIQRSGVQAKNVYLIVNGVAEVVQSSRELDHMLSAGTLIGELEALGGEAPAQTYRARSYVNALAIPTELYRLFIQRNADLRSVTASCEAMLFLQTTWLFGEMVSSPVMHRVVQAMETRLYPPGDRIKNFDESSLFLVKSGRGRVLMDDREIEVLGPGDFFGEESIFFGKTGSLFSLVLDEDSQLFVIKGSALRDIPIIEWKIVETYERRLRAFGESVSRIHS
ncbi:cyclic nucleotide-binding domain-containing protein [Spirochaeta lutea]|uniref:Cyclic nucleotide-binding domain-containing protein n=1 Tax=Spirochaeta lutea TaxID=1480694 RepID=A0A098QVF5_9SPIO|nr:cyclic nucleotide-binding domain-containing protein [Spirochaeta lutea]KGE71719.1 hypothetical protein DC28_10755 [Spirochaeta lutea]